MTARGARVAAPHFRFPPYVNFDGRDQRGRRGGASRRGSSMKDPVKTQRREDRAEAERQLDEAIEESFPASDPLPTTRTSAGAPDHSVRTGALPQKAGRGAAKKRR